MRHQHAMEAHMDKSFATFADLASFIDAETGNQDRSSIYEGAFMAHEERAKLSPVDETEQLESTEERRGGHEWVSTCRSWWCSYQKHKQTSRKLEGNTKLT